MMASSAGDDKLDVVRPEHPLPDEIRKMKRDQTVCKYCGVSYLIHSEIKALEEKLRSTQKELENYKRAEILAKQLEIDLQASKETTKDLETE